MRQVITVSILSALALLTAACSGSSNSNSTTTTNTTTATTNSAPTTTTNPGNTANANSDHAGDDKVPAEVRAAFPDAQQITKQHKDITAAQIASIEKETGAKIKDTDHHSYFAFATVEGTRKQVGAATQVDAGGKKLVIVYESRDGVPYIKEVRADGVPQAFLDQFKGKGHDNKFEVGGDIKALGADEGVAKAVAQAIRLDSMIMQTLYGKPDHH